MYNPPHPGEFIFDIYLEPSGLSCRYLAKQQINLSNVHAVNFAMA